LDYVILARTLAILSLCGAGLAIPTSMPGTAAQPKPGVRLIVPPLSEVTQAGKQAFDRHCAGCHGAHAAGSPTGPPLVHRIYGPGHHGDAAFLLAVRRGVRAHHWRFGDMPPQPQVGGEEVARIVCYVRELQRANGITP
jgi:mono/diheme cytochrome c family protein